MTRKQVKRLAQQFLAWERVHQDPNSSKHDKRDAETNILQLTNMLMAMPNGFTVLTEIDDIIQCQLANEQIKNKEN